MVALEQGLNARSIRHKKKRQAVFVSLPPWECLIYFFRAFLAFIMARIRCISL